MKTVNLNINGCLPQVRDGRDGVDGKSAYQQWLDLGNTGSEADFINSLKGADGIIGRDGATGPKGDTGEKGDKGDKGDSLFEDAKLEEGKLIITKPDGSKLEVPVPVCPDILLVDAFDTVEVGYINSVTCDKSEVEPESKAEEPVDKAYPINLDVVFATDEKGIIIDNINPSYVVAKVSGFNLPDTAIDSALTAKLVIKSVGNNSQRVVREDAYLITIPAGKTYGSAPYISHSFVELVSKAADNDYLIITTYVLTVENYSGKYIILPSSLPNFYQSIDRL
mgnify:CR=1 FL=1